MASPRAARWPPPLPPLPLLLLLLLLLLLPPPPASPGPSHAPRRGRSGRLPRGASAAAVRNHWPENSTEPHTDNIAFDQNPEDFQTVGSKEGTSIQTSKMSHTSSEAPEDVTLLIEKASAEGRKEPSRRTDSTLSPTEHSPESARVLTSQGSIFSLESLHLPSSSSESEGRTASPHVESRTVPGVLQRAEDPPGAVTVHTQVSGTSALSQTPLPALEPGEPAMLSVRRDSSGPQLSSFHFSRTPVYPSSDYSSSPGSIKELTSSIFQNPSVSQTKSMHVSTTFTNGAQRELQLLTVSQGPINKTVGFPEDSKITTTSAAVHSSPSTGELRRNGTSKNPADELIEQSTENEFDLTSLHKQNDSPTFGSHLLTSTLEAGNKSSTHLKETVSKSVPSIGGGQSTPHWLLTNSKTPADVTGSSASRGEVLTQFSDSAQQSTGRKTAVDEKSYSESLSPSFSQSLESLAQRGEHSTPARERSTAPGVSSAGEESTSGAQPRDVHTSATLAGSGERTLRSLSLTDAATSAEAGSSGVAASEAESSAQRSNATDDVGLLAQSTAAFPALGVTGLSGQVSGTDAEQRTSSDHRDHTYVSSTFTKGERALLSITDNISSPDINESSTSYIKIPNSSSSDYSSSSHVQTKRSNVSSYDGKYIQPSTESLVLHTSSFPSYTSTIKVPNIFVPLDANTGSVDDSSSGSPLPPPEVSQSFQVSSSLPLTRTSTHQLKSTSEVSTTLSSSLLSVSSMASIPLSVSQATLPHSSYAPILSRTRETPVTSVQTLTIASSIAMSQSNQTADPNNQSMPHQGKTTTEAKSSVLVSLPTEFTESVTKSTLTEVPVTSALTESSTEPALTAMSTSLARVSPTLTIPSFKTSHPPVISPNTLSNTEPLITGTVLTTSGKQHLPTHPEILVPQITTERDITTERNQVHVDATTQLIALTSIPTSGKELSTRLGVTEESSPASPFLRTSPFSKSTDVSTAEMLTPQSTTLTAQTNTQSPTALSPVNSCAVNPCLHDGKCIVDLTSRGYRCVCPPSWQGDNCSVDVNECLLNRCPRQAICNNTQGSFICRCPVGYHLEKGICNLVRTFVTEFKLKKQFLNTTLEKYSDVHEVENEITKMLNVCFSTLPGYIQSTAHVSREPSVFVTSLQATFSLASSVTLFDLNDGIQKFVNSCRSSAEVCQLLGSQARVFRAGSLCKQKSPQCDTETSICTDLDGVALCQCKSGYFQFNKMDHSCRACEDGYRLENETCMSCPFGLGGLNCGNPYQLITVVIAAAGGGLLLILGIALIVTCCRKNKNDISKLIFKSGDFQMSPYAEYPKNPRSQEWGREAIEMHENGSTKNLLQMTDVYYSPTNVRNPELERNGLYPAYTGLPGSRHSCIFPGQYNPSFISDESRRRDYF
ncbi:protein HEG homolog 1 [Cavia porcellus]